MKRILLILTVALVMVAGLALTSAPAFAGGKDNGGISVGGNVSILCDFDVVDKDNNKPNNCRQQSH